MTGTDADGLAIKVESNKAFRAGEDLVIYDVQPGDDFQLGCWVHLARDGDGKLRALANAPTTVRLGSKTVRIEPVAGGSVAE